MCKIHYLTNHYIRTISGRGVVRSLLVVLFNASVPLSAYPLDLRRNSDLTIEIVMYTTYAPSSVPSLTPDARPPRLSASPPSLPTGGCRFILLHPSVQNQRCSCQAFHHNENVPGSSCDCGHQACYHVHTQRPPSQPSPEQENLPASSNATLLVKIRKLEDALQIERAARREETRLRQRELKDETLAREKEIRILREALAPFYRSEEEIKRKMIELEDQVEGNYDEQVGLLNRVMALDAANDRLERLLAGFRDNQKRPPSNRSPSMEIDRNGSSIVASPNQDPTPAYTVTENSHITEVQEKRLTNISVLDLSRPLKVATRRSSAPASDMASSIDPNELSISASVSPALTPALAPPMVEDNHPRSSGVLDLPLSVQTVNSPPDSSCRTSVNPAVDFAPSPNLTTAFVQAFPKFASALAPYEIPMDRRARRFSDSTHRVNRSIYPRSTDLATAWIKGPNKLREIFRESSLAETARNEGRKRKRKLDEDGIYHC